MSQTKPNPLEATWNELYKQCPNAPNEAVLSAMKNTFYLGASSVFRAINEGLTLEQIKTICVEHFSIK